MFHAVNYPDITNRIAAGGEGGGGGDGSVGKGQLSGRNQDRLAMRVTAPASPRHSFQHFELRPES